MTQDEKIQKLIERSLKSDCEHEIRFALVMSRVLAMREALTLEQAVENEPLAAALLGSGVNAIDASIEILSMFWGRK